MATEQGVAAAQYNLGISYYTGDGVKQDYAKGLQKPQNKEVQMHKAIWAFVTIAATV